MLATFCDDAATLIAAVKNSFDLGPRLSFVHTKYRFLIGGLLLATQALLLQLLQAVNILCWATGTYNSLTLDYLSLCHYFLRPKKLSIVPCSALWAFAFLEIGAETSGGCSEAA